MEREILAFMTVAKLTKVMAEELANPSTYHREGAPPVTATWKKSTRTRSLQLVRMTIELEP